MSMYVDIENMVHYEVKIGSGKEYVLLPIKHLCDLPIVDAVKVTRCKDCWAFEEHNDIKMKDDGFGYCMAHVSCTPITMRDWFCRNGSVEMPSLKV